MLSIVIAAIIGEVGIEFLAGEIFLAEMLHHLEHLLVLQRTGQKAAAAFKQGMNSLLLQAEHYSTCEY